MTNRLVTQPATVDIRKQAYELADLVAKQHPRGYINIDDHLILYYQTEILKALENASGIKLISR